MASNYKMKLSKNHTMPIEGFRKNGTNSNLLVIGSSGTGKTMNVVLPMLLDDFKNEPVTFVVQDCKGMLYKNLSKKFMDEGYIIKVLDFTKPTASNRFNPLEYVTTIDDARKIISPIVLAQVKSAKDPFWEIAAIDLLSNLIIFVKENFDKKLLNFYFLNAFLKYFAKDYSAVLKNKGKQKIIDINVDRNFQPHIAKEDEKKNYVRTVFYEKLMKLYKQSNAPAYITDLATYFGYGDSTFNSIIAVAKAALSVYSGDKIKNIVMGRDQMRLHELANTKTIIFVNPSDTSRVYDPIVGSFYNMCFEKVVASADNCKNGRLKIPFRLIIDDFASGTKIIDFDKAISNIRSRNISCTLLVQSMSQLESIYSKPEANTIIANCSTQLYLGSNDFEQELYISKRLNMPYDKIHELDRNKLIIIEENKKPEIDDKYCFDEHPNYSKSGINNKRNRYNFERIVSENHIHSGITL